ncbi:H-NS family nucleoid-associated regulatory protein [Burkholderia contaminans]|uniref:H-NS histone family protein n=1 Tax=Burkholderia contaminans TaxID=488447 RepID=A0A3N8RNQ8_9BURK|nr:MULTISPECIES: H-NS histone family protein [Burkholderia cepacia complex]RQT37512.1 H-NS histone family protein [Burkholderia contaminans]
MTKRYPELKAQLEALDRQIAQARESARNDAIAAIRALMDEFGIHESELASKRGGRRTGASAPKYRDPETGQTWSGRGKAPAWIAGQDRARFANVGNYIDAGAQAG